MKLKIIWHKHPSEKDTIIGICDELPDSYSQFSIRRMSKDSFWAIPATLIMDSIGTKLILRDAETAKDFCEDFLNTNIKTIVRYQIRHMKESSAKTEKSVFYYENILDKILESEIKLSSKTKS